MAITAAVPCALYIGTKILIDNDIKAHLNKQFIFVCGSGLLVFIGKLISERIMHFESSDGEMIWTALDHLRITYHPFL